MNKGPKISKKRSQRRLLKSVGRFIVPAGTIVYNVYPIEFVEYRKQFKKLIKNTKDRNMNINSESLEFIRQKGVPVEFAVKHRDVPCGGVVHLWIQEIKKLKKIK